MALFNERLKEALKLREITQTELAKRTGIDKATISHYVSGSYKAKSDNLYLIAKALDVAEPWLMGLDVPMKRVEPADNSELTIDDREVMNILASLSEEKRSQAISYLRYLRDSSEHK